jgi:hypothetical protein
VRYAGLLALCLVLAGCNGPLEFRSTATDQTCQTATSAVTSTSTRPVEPTPAATPTSASRVNVRGDEGRLPVNATTVWLRVLALHGLSPTEIPAPVVTVSAASEQRFDQTDLDGDIDRFGRLIGLNENQSESVTLSTPDGFVVPSRYNDGNYTKVRLEVAEDDSAAAAEATLAHEYVHVVQVETNFSLTDDELAAIQANVPRAIFADIREGAAEYVADVYAQRYLAEVDLSAERRSAYEQARPNAWKLSRAGYYYGYCHVAARVDSPRELPAVYAAPPETNEQLIHGLAPGEEPPVPLSVRAGAGWERRGTVGELHLQVALTEHLSESRAAEAATGWGNDTLLRRGDGYVWVVRMDTAANASALETPLRAHVDGLAAASDPIDRPANVSYRVVRVNRETLALVVGDEAFVDTVRISDDDETVSVSTRSTAALGPERGNQVFGEARALSNRLRVSAGS